MISCLHSSVMLAVIVDVSISILRSGETLNFNGFIYSLAQ